MFTKTYISVAYTSFSIHDQYKTFQTKENQKFNALDTQ